MNINFYPRRDDFNDRLFSFLSNQLPLTIEKIIKIRQHVFLVRTENLAFILKAYSSLTKLWIQQDLTDSLKEAGFHETYSFFQFTEEPLFFENFYYGCMEYIPAKKPVFTFRTQTERKEGLELLSKFHSNSETLIRYYASLLPKQDLLAKWEVRFERFKANLPIVNYYVSKKITSELIEWGYLALTGMKKYQAGLENEHPVILHGDVAHHNFLRAKTGKLYLIDFDLVSVGPESFDLLQYANRILPSMGWSIKSLFDLSGLANYKDNQGFLYGLMFPADIFREWNRLIRQNDYQHPSRLAPLIDLTVNQFYDRKRFIEQLKRMSLP